MSIRIAVGIAVLCAAASAPASAQPRLEVSAFGGWTLSDGVTGTTVVAPDGNVYDTIEPDDSGSFGFSVGALLTDNAEVGFLYGRQPTTLVLSGTADRDIGDMAVSTYHGYFAYNFGAADAAMRPFVFGGIGATNFGSVDFTFAGVDRSIEGHSKFSSTWGGGIKAFFSPHLGARASVKWTPTYIKSDTAGWWCDPFWGCYLVGDAQYANQFEFSGGVTARF